MSGTHSPETPLRIKTRIVAGRGQLPLLSGRVYTLFISNEWITLWKVGSTTGSAAHKSLIEASAYHLQTCQKLTKQYK